MQKVLQIFVRSFAIRIDLWRQILYEMRLPDLPAILPLQITNRYCWNVLRPLHRWNSSFVIYLKLLHQLWINLQFCKRHLNARPCKTLSKLLQLWGAKVQRKFNWVHELQPHHSHIIIFGSNWSYYVQRLC